jgi:hypothetical protein
MSKRISVHTDIEKFLSEEERHSESLSGTKALRVKPEEVGDAWLVRFLPVGLGKKQRWFIRQAKHWFKKSPATCPRHTADDFGGDEKAPCPVCDLSKELRDDTDDEISKLGFDIRPNVTYTVYCIVIKIQKRRQEAKEFIGEELLIPWEFQMYAQTFDELRDYFRRGVSAKRPLSILDLEHGNDFWATKTKKGIRLDKDDPGPAFDKNVTEEEIDEVFSSIKEPRIKIPSLKELNAFARKVEDFVYEGAEPAQESRSTRGSRLRDAEPDSDKDTGGDDDADQPHRQGRHSRSEAAADETEGRRARREPEQAEARSRSSEPAPEPAPEPAEERRSRRSEPAPEPEPERRSRREEAAAEPERRARREEAAAEPERRARRTAQPEPEPEPDPEDQIPGAEVPAKGSRRAPAEEPEKEEEDAGVAEENRDPVPPRRAVTGDDAAESARSEERRGRRAAPEPEPDQGDPADDQTDSPRSQTAGSVGGRGSGGRNSSLRQRISRISSRD